MEQLTAEQAIDSIKSVQTEIFGQSVQKFNYGNQIRRQLELMAQANTIRPAEYHKALKIVWESPCMMECVKRCEYEELNK